MKLFKLIFYPSIFQVVTALFTPCQSQESMEYKLVWGDEFNIDGRLDPEIWSYERGFVRNQEFQWYQQENVYCKGGSLIIEARQENIANKHYNKNSGNWKINRSEAKFTSASITTCGAKEFLFGRFEIKARIPLESGSWPAIWTLGQDMPWPSCGEIDMMEYYRINDVPYILANVAWGTDLPNNAKWDSAKIPYSHFANKDFNWGDNFHIWRMDWDETAIRLYLDDELLNETLLSETNDGTQGQRVNPFMQPHYLLLNLAIVGQHGGEPDLNAFPLKYEIDYVRIYQKNKNK